MFSLVTLTSLALKSTGILTFAPILSPSMEPAMHRGDLVVTTTLDTTPHVGDVYVYQDPNGAQIIHRLRSINTDGTLVFKGDNNNIPDKPIPPTNITAKHVATVPHLGKLILTITGQ